MKHRADWTEHIQNRFANREAPKPLKLTPAEPRESAVLASILQALNFCPNVAWAERFNSGAYTIGEGATRRYVRFGFPGCSDIIGQLKDGRFLAIEVKRPSGRATEAQEAFLQRVRDNGGVAILARFVDDVVRILGG